MARSYANLATGIWRDDEFRVLSLAAQHAYLLLMSQPDISAAGVLSLNLTRWASRTKDVTRAGLRVALEELEAHRFVVVDEETEELLVRSFVRWDNGYSNPKRIPVIRDAISQIESSSLLRALSIEFERLGLADEKWRAAFPQVNSLYPDAEIAHPESADRQPASERVVVSTGSREDPSTLTPQQAILVPRDAVAPRVAARKRGTRVPDDFPVTPEMVAWARAETPGVDGKYETAKFVDYWGSKAGRDATKVDWIKAWRNWMRKAQEHAESTARRPTNDQRVGQAMAIGAQLQAELDQKEIEA